MIKYIIDNIFSDITDIKETTIPGDMVDSGYLNDLGIPNLKNDIWDLKDNDYYFTFHHS